ncbi:hypothetical protein AWA1501_11810 [Lactiplantibacillus pentosus]|nr:hypothetical protein AWA1501_11810 [Lactiplantibacillus pentosus]
MKSHLASVFGLVSERPVFKTWAVGLNLCPPRSGHCTECLEAGVGSIYYSKFTVTRTVSSGSQLAALELRKWHVLIMIHNTQCVSMFKVKGGQLTNEQKIYDLPGFQWAELPF